MIVSGSSTPYSWTSSTSPRPTKPSTSSLGDLADARFERLHLRRGEGSVRRSCAGARDRAGRPTAAPACRRAACRACAASSGSSARRRHDRRACWRASTGPVGMIEENVCGSRDDADDVVVAGHQPALDRRHEHDRLLGAHGVVVRVRDSGWRRHPARTPRSTPPTDTTPTVPRPRARKHNHRYVYLERRELFGETTPKRSSVTKSSRRMAVAQIRPSTFGSPSVHSTVRTRCSIRHPAGVRTTRSS